LVAEFECVHIRHCAFDEEPDRGESHRLGGGQISTGWRQAQGSDTVDPLTGNTQGLAAGREEADVLSPGQQDLA